ncbi:hypothetical protein [Candidatus Mycoplasma haematominutum]|uniref:ATP synthase subunit b n=1 Tax=Candidatus Mycoplasma haematominutum 'Birmingham 1' TaxID=1116213 RepID=G8C3A4_9MOLU|nr:hypothetical protein [Candidatus Mycoplasma haematominutum]CCE66802.1 hypothetical protein MHM_02840 [Candidatus Mycoplasma haematominutum 'Birmingham 1']
MDDGQTRRTWKIAADNGGLSSLIQDFIKFFVAASPQVIVAHILSSISTIVFIVYFFWKPTNKFIVKQKEKLDKAHTDLATVTKETRVALGALSERRENLAAEHTKFLSEKDEREKRMIAQKMEEIEKEKHAILREASLRAKEIELEAKRTVNDKIISLSVELAEKLIKASIDKKVQSKIIGNYLSEIDTAFQKNTSHQKKS